MLPPTTPHLIIRALCHVLHRMTRPIEQYQHIDSRKSCYTLFAGLKTFRFYISYTWLHFNAISPACYVTPVMLCYAMQVFCSKIGLAPYIEVALHHRKAKVLMVTDAVVYIPQDPPEASPPPSQLYIIIRRVLSEFTLLATPRATAERATSLSTCFALCTVFLLCHIQDFAVCNP